MPGVLYLKNDRSSLLANVFKTWGNTMFKNYITEEAGASAAEYALILAIVGAVIATATIALRTQIVTAIDNATANVTTANASTGASV